MHLWLEFAILLSKYNGKPIDFIIKKYPQHKTTIENYFLFAAQNRIGHFIHRSMVQSFPSIAFDFQYPGIITNCVVEISSSSNLNITTHNIIELSKKFGTLNFLLIIHSIKSLNDITNLFSTMRSIRYSHLEVISSLLTSQCNHMIEEQFDLGVINRLSFYNSSSLNQNKNINYYSKNLSNSSCTNICINRMIVNMDFYAESIKYHSCLNRKISIDSHGNIKNCPSCPQSFGNIKDSTLEQALNHPDFKKYWNITKDQIDVCKDCEFRHMCTDCRMFIKDPENIYSQPAKCTYNPYIAKWQGEEGYIPVEECGTYTRKTGFVPNKERIAELNREIWGE